MSIQVGANCLEREHGGRGMLLGGVPGVEPANVLILGGGVVRHQRGEDGGRPRCQRHDHGHRPRAPALPRRRDGREREHRLLEPRATSARASRTPTSSSAPCCSRAPARRCSSRARTCEDMKDGSVIVDIAVDQGGCCETTKATTHDDPTYVVDGVVHYGVANMPGAVPRTSTFALTNATLPWVRKLARMGAEKAVRSDTRLALRAQRLEGQDHAPRRRRGVRPERRAGRRARLDQDPSSVESLESGAADHQGAALEGHRDLRAPARGRDDARGVLQPRRPLHRRPAAERPGDRGRRRRGRHDLVARQHDPDDHLQRDRERDHRPGRAAPRAGQPPARQPGRRAGACCSPCILGVVFGVPPWLFAEEICRALGATGAVIAPATDYLAIMSAGHDHDVPAAAGDGRHARGGQQHAADDPA